MGSKVSAIIPAGGVGRRFGSNCKKQYHFLNDKPIIFYTLKRLISSYPFCEIVIGAAEEDYDFLFEVCSNLDINNVKFAERGVERYNTVYNAAKLSHGDYLLVHDAVRPCVDKKVVENVIHSAFDLGAAICGIKPVDTVKCVENGMVKRTLNRNNLLLVHTPQCFKREILIKALENILSTQDYISDDSSAVEIAGNDVAVVMSNPENIKVTTKSDLIFLEKYLKL